MKSMFTTEIPCTRENIPRLLEQAVLSSKQIYFLMDEWDSELDGDYEKFQNKKWKVHIVKN